MGEIVYNLLELREIFHLEFLRWLGRKIKVKYYALKGGVNLRFYFNSFRYSQNMDLDICGQEVGRLKDIVMEIFKSSSFHNILKPFGVEEIVPADISRAKQAETAQRFKVHLITCGGEDLFTKVEFSRRRFKGNVVVQPVSDIILRRYKLPPLLVPHYDIQSAVMQKINALASRPVIQPRDIFDLYLLSSQLEPIKIKELKISGVKLKRARENLFEISFKHFRDTVISYLGADDQSLYDSAALWDEIKLKVADLIDEVRKGYI